MQHTAIIPYGDGAGFVVDTELVIRPGGVLEQILKNRLALITVQSFDPLGEIAVYIQRLFARLRMRDYNRVGDWMFGQLEIKLTPVMFCEQGLNKCLHGIRQTFIGLVLIGIERCTTQ